MSKKIMWPEGLIEDLGRGRCIIFLGAGISASAKDTSGNRPKAWKEFLLYVNEKYITSKKDKTYIKKLINNGQFLMALQIIYDLVDRGTYNTIIEKEYKEPDYKPSKIHEIVSNIDPKMIITTNFDIIYEKAVPTQAITPVVYNSSSNFADLIRSNSKVLVYAHGNVRGIRDTIFTKKQYYEAKRDNPEFYEILQAVFMTNTILFLGCGLCDPDMSLILESVNIKTNASKPHYNVALDGNHKSILNDWKNSYNIHTLEYGPSHENLYENLQELRDLIDVYRVENGIVNI